MSIEVELVSPERLLFSRQVDMAVVPSVEGDLAAMVDHAPMIVLLRGGLVTLYENDRATDTLYVEGGFAEITAERCTILADAAIPPSEIDRADADARLADAQRAWAEADMSDEVEVPRLLASLQLAQSRVDAASG